MSQHVVRQIPVFRFRSYADSDTDKFLSSKFLDQILDPVVSSGASLFTDPELPRIQINIVINYDHLCFRVYFEIIRHIPHRTAA